ncbi:DNA-directed RNA polymerase subunit alpha [Desulfomicrobium apsheronum]|uniref:DNA-directed RNA polymerase subunit alpha n=1 Tax=Desulfomicrobium apsheronum TaxID=52560 RepID=A0A1I3XDX2_9BACT|nr:DNA-directed RNA polymerase subunit alpha [Desulfomicrobium apsheronum]MDY0226368.1 DNA-directed RNA polymerase subunit alpha [Desulfomicrobium apsheronum]SFK17549.1 DNA-directed RNA polymerase subunit alpha [Desulfomicrobium apsheronum]
MSSTYSGDKKVYVRNWAELVRPEQLEKDPKCNDMYGRFVCEPLERGFGTTIGNALRRVLLSSLQGAAPVSVNIQGIQHEFTTIPGVNEDVTDIVLNLKQLRVAMNTPEPQRVQLIANAKGEVTASAIVENQHIKILNPDLHIATLSEDIDLVMNLEFRMGKGYVPAEMHEDLDSEIGVITLDSSFSPIRKVAYAVEQARVGQMTNYDKLIIEVWTDGSITPDDALAFSAKILKEQLTVFINFDEGSADIEKAKSKPQDKINENLFKNIEDLELPVRASNCLKSAGIHIVGELVQKTEADLLKTKNFGRKSLEDIRRVLESMGLDFGIRVDNFDELYQDWLKRNEEDEA